MATKTVGVAALIIVLFAVGGAPFLAVMGIGLEALMQLAEPGSGSRSCSSPVEGEIPGSMAEPLATELEARHGPLGRSLREAAAG